MGNALSQMFPPNASLTEANLPSQTGKVFIVTGGASGIGLALSTILYHSGGKVYIAGRSRPNFDAAVTQIKTSPPPTTSSPVGSLHYLPLQLDDLSTIKESVALFTSQETKLDVLWNNAGVSLPPAGSKSAQGYELMLAVNCLGPLLFTKLLHPALRVASKESNVPFSTRIVWTASQIIELSSPTGGFTMRDVNPQTREQDQQKNYCISKLGNWFLASELAFTVRKDGILSLAINPGAAKTNLLRDHRVMYYAAWFLLHDAKQGAYTELYAGLSQELGEEHEGGYVIPWGRVHTNMRADLLDAVKEGGSGMARYFSEWCERKIEGYL